MGLYRTLREGSPYARLRGRFARTTSEVQRNIIAGRGLGLPRG